MDEYDPEIEARLKSMPILIETKTRFLSDGTPGDNIWHEFAYADGKRAAYLLEAFIDWDEQNGYDRVYFISKFSEVN